MTEMEELRVLRSALADIDNLVPGPPRPVAVGIVDDRADDGDALEATLRALRLAVAVGEIARRMPGHAVRSFTRASSLPLCGLAGEVVEPLPFPEGASEPDLRGEADAVVVLDGDGGWRDPSALRLTAADTPDVVVLASRLGPEALLESRRQYLVLTGGLPADGPYVLCLPAASAGDELEKVVQELAVVVRPDPPPGPVDLLGLIHSAAVVVTSSSAVAAAAVSLGRPVVVQTFNEMAQWTGRFGAGHLEDLASLIDVASEAGDRAALMDEVDRRFDELCLAIEQGSVPAVARTTVERVAAMGRRLAAVESANAGLREVLLRERLVMAHEIRRRDAAEIPEEESLSATVLARRLAVEQKAASDLRAEIERIYATRTMRMMAPVRRTYGRLHQLLK
jgi:hypothetical protein